MGRGPQGRILEKGDTIMGKYMFAVKEGWKIYEKKDKKCYGKLYID